FPTGRFKERNCKAIGIDRIDTIALAGLQQELAGFRIEPGGMVAAPGDIGGMFSLENNPCQRISREVVKQSAMGCSISVTEVDDSLARRIDRAGARIYSRGIFDPAREDRDLPRIRAEPANVARCCNVD